MTVRLVQSRQLIFIPFDWPADQLERTGHGNFLRGRARIQIRCKVMNRSKRTQEPAIVLRRWVIEGSCNRFICGAVTWRRRHARNAVPSKNAWDDTSPPPSHYCPCSSRLCLLLCFLLTASLAANCERRSNRNVYFGMFSPIPPPAQ